MKNRHQTRVVQVGNVSIGGGAPVSVQSMTNTKTTDVAATLVQIRALVTAGCQIVRLAVPNQESVKAFAEIRKQVSVPLVADIHFDHNLALGALDAGADKIRINPGNIGNNERVKEVVQKAVACNAPIRVGVNSGSIHKSILEEEGGPTVNALVRSGLENLNLCREFGAEHLVLSLKSSDVLNTIAAYRQAAERTDIPLHIGITEAGSVRTGAIRSAIGLGILLNEGVGDTLRVSLTGDPVEEVYTAFDILQALELTRGGIRIISCPTCARTEVDMVSIVNKVEQELRKLKKDMTIAIMGCVVNGPGEAKEADIGVACGKNSAVLFKHGEIVKKINEKDIVQVLLDEVHNWQ